MRKRYEIHWKFGGPRGDIIVYGKLGNKNAAWFSWEQDEIHYV